MNKLILLLLLLLMACTEKEQVANQTINLLADNNLEQFDYVLKDSLLSKSDIWSINEGILYCSGEVYGYIFTKKEYSNYKLSFNWRWPDNPGNSGVLLHIAQADSIWPLCIEAQLFADNAGDFIMMGGSSIKEQTDKTKIRVEKFKESNEKAAGEWNSYEIECREDNISLIINGILQNKASQASLKKGKIGLQSEGMPIEFKNIIIETL